MTIMFYEFLVAVATPVVAVIGFFLQDAWLCCRDVRLF